MAENGSDHGGDGIVVHPRDEGATVGPEAEEDKIAAMEEGTGVVDAGGGDGDRGQE